MADINTGNNTAQIQNEEIVFKFRPFVLKQKDQLSEAIS